MVKTLQDNKKQPTFFIHDYETFGKRPALDRPAQFAASAPTLILISLKSQRFLLRSS